ncbi:TPA: Na+/H+ antiporter [Aeromonas veronii]
MNIFLTILILIFFVAFTEVAKKTLLKFIPLPVMQIIVGAGISFPLFNLDLSLEPDVFILLFIPPLLFVDGVKAEGGQLLKQWKNILSLAVFLVIFSMIIVGVFLNYALPNTPFWACIALAAILSPTDMVALNGMLGDRNIPSKIKSIVEGEALLNDASALVSFKMSISILLGIVSFSYETFVLDFITVAVGGIITGTLVVYLYIAALKFLSKWLSEEPTIQIVLLILLPFLCYLIAEKLEVSGILSAVSAGLFVKHSKFIESSDTIMQNSAKNVWSMFETLLNGMIFIILGSQMPSIVIDSFDSSVVDEINFFKLASIAFISYSLLLITRFTWVFIQGRIFSRIKLAYLESYTFRECLIITFSGVRGAITLAGVLSIPFYIGAEPFSERYQLLFIAASVILFSIFLPMLILPFLLPCKINPASTFVDELSSNLIEVRLDIMNHVENEITTVKARLTRYGIFDEKELNSTANTIIDMLKMRCTEKHLECDKWRINSHILLKIAIKSEKEYAEKLENESKIDKKMKQRILNDLFLLESLFYK